MVKQLIKTSILALMATLFVSCDEELPFHDEPSAFPNVVFLDAEGKKEQTVQIRQRNGEEFKREPYWIVDNGQELKDLGEIDGKRVYRGEWLEFRVSKDLKYVTVKSQPNTTGIGRRFRLRGKNGDFIFLIEVIQAEK